MNTMTLANANAVPGTGRHGYGGRFYRVPRHIGTKRALEAAYGTLRGVTVPPSAWDDIGRSAWRDRSWKRNRLTRYKPLLLPKGKLPEWADADFS